MKIIHFMLSLFFLGLLPNLSFGQALEQTACGTLTIDSEVSTPISNAYFGGRIVDCIIIPVPAMLNGARINAFTYTLRRRNTSGIFEEIEVINTDAPTFEFENLDDGVYFVTVRITTANTSIVAADPSCKAIGFAAGNPTVVNSNREIVGDPQPAINMEDTYCCEEDVFLNTFGTFGTDDYVITICQKADPADNDCINWRSTGWVAGDVPTSFDLLNLWNQGGSNNWTFWSDYHYEVMLAVANECNSWVPITHTFFVSKPQSVFSISDANGNPVNDGGILCESASPPMLDASASSCGDAYLISICQYSSSSPEVCINWRSTGWIEGDVSQIGDMIDLLSIWNNDGLHNWVFWNGYNYRVSLVLSSGCENWVSSDHTFTTVGNCFHGGDSAEDRAGVIEEHSVATQIYPTLLDAQQHYLNVVLPTAVTTANLVIYDLQGRVLRQEALANQQNEVLLEGLGKGLYVAVVYDRGEIIQRAKLVVQ